MAENENSSEITILDSGNIKGTVIEVTDNKVKIDGGTKQGLNSDKDKGKFFTVERQNIPIARLKLEEIGENTSTAEIQEILKGITLKAGDKITSEINILDQGDLLFLDNPLCEFVSKTPVAGGDKLIWTMEKLSSDLIGESHMLTCYGHNEDVANVLSVTSSIFGGFLGNIAGDVAGSVWGSKDESFVYLFDEKGEKKWGSIIDMCIFKFSEEEGLSYLSENVKIKPEYKIYSDRIYFNTFNVRKGLLKEGIMITSGVIFGLNLETGKELWRLKDSVFGFDPVLYGLIYDNFIDKVCYLYSSKSSLYAMNLTGGEFIWEFPMHNEGIAEGVFDEKDGFIYASDKDSYFYKVDVKTGKAQWEIKTDFPVAEVYHLSEENTLYLFDSKSSVYGIDKAKGILLWKYVSESPFTSQNFMSGNVIYIFNSDSIAALSKNKGEKIWKVDIKNPSPLDKNITDTLYSVSEDLLYGIDVTGGKIKWNYKGDRQIKKILSVKDIFYILSKNSVSAVDMSGKELWKKANFSDPVYLEKQKLDIDPYSIKLSKTSPEDDLIFIAGSHGFLAINPSTHEIVSDKNLGESLVKVTGDSKCLYMSSLNHIWSVDMKKGTVAWDRPFSNTITFMPEPGNGEIYFDRGMFDRKNTISSQSKKLLGVIAGEEFYILSRETGEIVSQGKGNEAVYPYLEVQAMNKAGEKIEGVYFYYNKGYLYTLRGKNL
jgi:outer membrane protein assembly factor BamB